MDGMFENLNQNANLEYIIAESPDDLHKTLLSIRHPLYIVSIYSFGSRHIAWFRTEATIIKKPKQIKGAKNG